MTKQKLTFDVAEMTGAKAAVEVPVVGNVSAEAPKRMACEKSHYDPKAQIVCDRAEFERMYTTLSNSGSQNPYNGQSLLTLVMRLFPDAKTWDEARAKHQELRKGHAERQGT